MELTKSLERLNEVEKKVSNFESDFKKLWDRNKKLSERLVAVEEKNDAIDFEVNPLSSTIIQLQKSKKKLQEDVSYVQSHSMSNNLVFSNIPEVPAGNTEDAEKALLVFLRDKLRVVQDIVDNIGFEIVHRSGPKETKKHCCQFTLFKEREMVRKQSKALEGINFYMNKQFPKVVDKRKKLVLKLKAARNARDRAWISYYTLSVNGKPLRD